jgi:hypothetical protein
MMYRSSSDTKSTVEVDQYYIPEESNNPTFDAFLHYNEGSDKRAIGYQMTIGRDHSFKQVGLGKLRDRARAFQKPMGRSFPAIFFVFVIPKGTKKFSVPINRQLGKVKFSPWKFPSVSLLRFFGSSFL